MINIDYCVNCNPRTNICKFEEPVNSAERQLAYKLAAYTPPTPRSRLKKGMTNRKKLKFGAGAKLFNEAPLPAIRL
jgi:hypothetical protein